MLCVVFPPLRFFLSYSYIKFVSILLAKRIGVFHIPGLYNISIYTAYHSIKLCNIGLGESKASCVVVPVAVGIGLGPLSF